MNGFIGLRIPEPLEIALKEKANQHDSNLSEYLRLLIFKDLFTIEPVR